MGSGMAALISANTLGLSYVASVRKSILSMLYGYWVERGIIDLETTIEIAGKVASRLEIVAG